MPLPVRRARPVAGIQGYRRRVRSRVARPVRIDRGAARRLRFWIRVLDAWSIPLPGSPVRLGLQTAASEAGVSVAAVRATSSEILREWPELQFSQRPVNENVRVGVESLATVSVWRGK